MPSGSYALYVAILAALATGAAYVPVDADDPDERAALVFGEANVVGVITEAGLVRGSGSSRGWRAGSPLGRDDAWIIFTSGSTGTPKGVAVTHRSAAAFVDAEAQMFLQDNPIGPVDRVLAGLSVAFDASCEEMWLAWRHGACLVPAPRSLVRSGMDLGPWLVSRDISVVSTVPTLAALWPAEALEAVRLLIFGGEACPPELAERLAAGPDSLGREVWNTYGPTEATVVACAAKLDGKGPVSIGLPLAGWDLAVVDKEAAPVAVGEVGELVIGGVGLARYLDPEKDAEKYAPMPTLGWDRAYRSGDLVRLEPDGLIFCGPRRRPGQGRRSTHRTGRGGRGAGEPARSEWRRRGSAPNRQRHTAARRLHRQRRPVVRPRRGSDDAGGVAARRAGASAGARRRITHPHIGQGRPGSAAVAAARRNRRRGARPRRHDGLAGRAVARCACRRGRRPRGRLLRARRRLAVGCAIGGRAASALPAGDGRRFVRPSAAGLAGRIPRRARPAPAGRNSGRAADAAARAGLPDGGVAAARHIDGPAVGGLAGGDQQRCRDVQLGAVAGDVGLVVDHRRVPPLRVAGRADGHRGALRANAGRVPETGHLSSRRHRSPACLAGREAGRCQRRGEPGRCAVDGVLRAGAGQQGRQGRRSALGTAGNRHAHAGPPQFDRARGGPLRALGRRRPLPCRRRHHRQRRDDRRTHDAAARGDGREER